MSRRHVSWRTALLPGITATIATALLGLTSTANAATGSVWSIVKSPNVTTGNFASNTLLSVAPVSQNDVWAVGLENKSGFDSSGDFPLIEHWDGTAWSVSQTGTQNADLTSVSADSANDAWAVGNVLNNKTLLAERWNGSAWSTVPMPEPAGAISARIEGVTALSASNAWAVGTFSDNALNLPLIEHWDGTSWSVVPNVPRQVAESNALDGVTAISPNDIWAVGHFSGGSTSQNSQLLMHWNGTSWSLAKPAQVTPGQSNNASVAVTANSSNDVWAVGGVDSTNSDGVTTQQPFAEHWDGTQWTEVATPAPAIGSAAFAFTAVTAVSHNDVWAVGLNAGDAFMEHWDGTSWTTTALPALGARGSSLFGIAKSGPSTLWAVGDNRPKSGLISQSLTLRTAQG